MKFLVTEKTDQKSIAFIFPQQTLEIKNEKLLRWRFELPQNRYNIENKPGSKYIELTFS